VKEIAYVGIAYLKTITRNNIATKNPEARINSGSGSRYDARGKRRGKRRIYT
jgi:hypothetical protein